jgi:succinylglutamic semialdehyde dehydrogenase
VCSSDLDALLFSGAYATAVEIRKATVERPELPILFQTGGKGAAIVVGGCEMNRAVYEVLLGAFLTAGQRQNSTGRVIVTADVFDQFASELTRRAKRLSVGYAFDSQVLLGPLISENFRTRYRRYGRALQQRGHGAFAEARNREVPGRRGFYVDPAVYQVNWENGNSFFNDEPAGPTLLLYKVKDWEEAVALHNRLFYRLTTSLFVAQDFPDLPEIVGRLKTGALNINRATISGSMRLQSVGLGRSSNGLPGGVDLVRFLSTPRCTLVENRPFDATQVAPGINWDDDDEPISVEVELDADAPR